MSTNRAKIAVFRPGLHGIRNSHEHSDPPCCMLSMLLQWFPLRLLKRWCLVHAFSPLNFVHGDFLPGCCAYSRNGLEGRITLAILANNATHFPQGESAATARGRPTVVLNEGRTAGAVSRPLEFQRVTEFDASCEASNTSPAWSELCRFRY